MILAGLLVAGIAWDLWYASTLRAEAARVEPARDRALAQDREFVEEARRQGFDLSPAALQRLPRDISFANRLIAERAFSWTKLLGELEQTVPAGLAISGVQHDLGKSSTIRLTGTARSLEVITAFILTLANHPMFYEPVLDQHREKGDGRTVDFKLHVEYHGGVS